MKNKKIVLYPEGVTKLAVEFSRQSLLVHTFFAKRRINYEQIKAVVLLRDNHLSEHPMGIPPQLLPFGLGKYLDYLQTSRQLLIAFRKKRTSKLAYFILPVPSKGAVWEELQSAIARNLPVKLNDSNESLQQVLKRLRISHNPLVTFLGAVVIGIVSVACLALWWLFLVMRENPETLLG